MIRLSAIVTQYDRRKYPKAIETLIALLDSLDEVSFRVLVVDNASDQEQWEHEFTDRLIHLSGDNRSWEFSAFDRGIDYARRHPFDEDLFLFVTDAYMAYGSEFLELIDREVVAASVAWQACFGIVDAFPELVEFEGRSYSDWLRTSFIFVPASSLPFIEPIAFPIDRGEVFGGTPEMPFREEASLSPRLRQYIMDWLVDDDQGPRLLQDQWHSKFRLDRKTYPFFEAKALAILREQALAMRLRDNHVPVFDFHVMEILRSRGDLRPSESRRPSRSLQWSGWRFVERRSHRHFLDHALFPETIQRGERLEIQVRGWASIDGGAESVQLEVSGQRGIERPCRQERLDLLSVSDDPKLGFFYTERFSGLPVGTNEIRLHFLEAGESALLGEVCVEPFFEFVPARTFIPDYADPAGMAVCELSGTLHSDRPVESVNLEINGVGSEGADLVQQGRGDRGEYRYRVRAMSEFVSDPDTTQLVVRLAFGLEGGGVRTWQKTHEIAIRRTPSFQIAIWDIRNRNLHRGGCPFLLEGEVALKGDRGELIVRRDGEDVLVESLQRRPSSRARVAPFRIERDALDLGTGQVGLSLYVRESEEERFLEQREFSITPDVAQLHVDEIVVERVRESPGTDYALRSSGWISNEYLMDSLALRVDGHLLSALSWGSIRHEVPGQTGSPLVRHQGFNFVTLLKGVTSGDHDVELVASGLDVPDATHLRRLRFPEEPSAGFLVVSEDLEAFDRRQPGCYYGEYVFEGTVHTICRDVVARLWIDSELAAECPIPEESEGEEFLLRARPATYGKHELRVTFSVAGLERYDSGARTFECRAIAIAPQSYQAWDRFFEHFELEGQVEDRLGPREALERLCFDRSDPSRHWIEILSDLGPLLDGRAERAQDPPALAIPEAGKISPLKVLFCSWEAPYSRHGGGVHLMNLLKGLGARHELTLVHTYGDDLQFAEEATPYVERMISVPRHNAALDYRDRGLLPARYYQEYVPRLEQVIDQELSTGRYDLINFETSILRMIPHRQTPSVLAVVELEYTAYLTHLRELATSRAIKVTEIGELLRLLWHNVVDLPRTFDALVTITPEDAQDIRTFSPESRVYANEAATEIRKKAARSVFPFGRKGARLCDPNEPRFLYLANYRHPPNLRGASFLLKEVMPRIRREIPNARLELVGPHAPPAITGMAHELDHFAGFVQNLEEVFDRADLMFLPIFTGTGMRIKAVESLGHGCPIVGTELGLRGIGRPDREAFVLAETAEEFARAAVELARNPQRLAKMRDGALRHANGFLNVERLVRDRERIWQTVTNGQPIS